MFDEVRVTVIVEVLVILIKWPHRTIPNKNKNSESTLDVSFDRGVFFYCLSSVITEHIFHEHFRVAIAFGVDFIVFDGLNL